MTNIYFNLRFLNQPLSGMQRYAQELITGLDELLQKHPDILKGAHCIGLLPPGGHRQIAWKAISVEIVGRGTGHLWEQTFLASHARSGPLVSLAGTGPLSHNCHVLALHDANVFANPEFFSRRYALLHQALRPRLLRRARRLITISEFSRHELAKYCRVRPEKFCIIPDSAEHILKVERDVSVLERANLRTGSYALCVGNQSPNKNIALARAAFSRVDKKDMKLALAGGELAALRSVRAEDADWIAQLGRVSDEELRTLYEHAAVFIFPSIYEGFGVPPLEAMSLGCPVVASDAAAMPEILGDAAILFKSGSIDACTAALREVLSLGPEQRIAMERAGRVHARRYTWESGARQLANLLSDLI